jgi:phospholipid/cholesterol/gamma-HCH transport system substrate-binding protein
MNTAAKVGAFFLIVLVLAALLIWRIEDVRVGKGKPQRITAEFKDVAGLDEKSAVRVAGVRVGKVGRIRVDPKTGKAVVELQIDPDVTLREGAVPQIANLGLLGEKYVELSPGPIGAPPLPAGAVLKGDVPVGFDEITRLGRDIEVQIKEISTSLNRSLGGAEGEERLRTIVENVRLITDDLRVLVNSNRGNVDSTLANFKEFSAMMTKLVDRVDRLVESNQENVTQGIANIREISKKLESTADNLNQITGKIESGQGTVGKLVQSEETHKNLNDTLVAVKSGVDGLNKALGAVQRTHFDFGMRGEYLTRGQASPSGLGAGQGAGKGYFTLDIDPPDSPRFYRLELSTQPNGRRIDTSNIYQITFPDGHTEIVTVNQTEFKDELAISAMVGWRWNGFTLRGGLIESRGGGGIDYATLRNRLRFSADMWDFNRPLAFAPHAKLTTRYYFSPSVYLTGGWDDFLNTSRKTDSVFVGAGIRWTDDDIKYLLGSVPIRP